MGLRADGNASFAQARHKLIKSRARLMDRTVWCSVDVRGTTVLRVERGWAIRFSVELKGLAPFCGAEGVLLVGIEGTESG